MDRTKVHSSSIGGEIIFNNHCAGLRAIASPEFCPVNAVVRNEK
jgi:hypothetical protein